MSIILCFKLYYSEHHLGTLIVKCVECGKSLLNKIKLNERGNFDHFDWNFINSLFSILYSFSTSQDLIVGYNPLLLSPLGTSQRRALPLRLHTCKNIGHKVYLLSLHQTSEIIVTFLSSLYLNQKPCNRILYKSNYCAVTILWKTHWV